MALRGARRALAMGVIGGGERTWTLPTVTTFAQSVSAANLITDGDMEGADPSSGWQLFGATVTGAADERTGGAGSQSMSITRNSPTNNNPGAVRDVTVVPGGWYVFSAWSKAVTCRDVWGRMSDAAHIWYLSFLTSADWALNEIIGRANTTSTSIRLHLTALADAQEGRVDDARLSRITLNPQLTLPGANVHAELVFTPPETSYSGLRMEVFYRIQGTLESEFNCWNVRMVRNASNDNWNFTFNSVANSVETNVYTLSDVGEPAGLRIVSYGSNHQVLMLVGETWIPLCPVIENGYLADKLGLNFIHSESITPTSLNVKSSSAFGSGLSGSSLAFIDGDSKSDPTNSYGYWDFMFKSLAEQRTGRTWSYYNVAAAGRYIGSAVTALPASLAALPATPEPDCALINFGANDVTQELNETTWKNSLRAYVETLHAKWDTTPIYVMLPWSPEYEARCDQLAAWIADVAAEYAYVYVGPDERVFLKGNDGGASTMIKPLPNPHPNGWGSRLTAQEWVDVAIP